MSGYVIFKVTTANGAIPLGNALVHVFFEKNNYCKKTFENGFCERFEFPFEEIKESCVRATAKILCPGFKDCQLEDLKIYRNLTIVRIVNLTKIQ